MSINTEACLLWGIDINPIKDQLPDDIKEAVESSGLTFKYDGLSGTWGYIGIKISLLDENDIHKGFDSINSFVLKCDFTDKIKQNTKISRWVKQLILNCPQRLYHFIYQC